MIKKSHKTSKRLSNSKKLYKKPSKEWKEFMDEGLNKSYKESLPKKKFSFSRIIKLALFAILGITIYFVGRFYIFNSFQPGNKYNLQVEVYDLAAFREKTPILYGTVEVVKKDDEKVVARKSLDGNNKVMFLLREGEYSVKMRSGYTGKIDVKMNTDRSIELKVLHVL